MLLGLHFSISTFFKNNFSTGLKVQCKKFIFDIKKKGKKLMTKGFYFALGNEKHRKKFLSEKEEEGGKD